MGLIVGNLLILGCIIFLIGNDFQMNEETVNITTSYGVLSGVMTIPKKGPIKGAIVFVHGEGAQNATQDGGYKPLMERFAEEGFVSLSWDKLGVGKSTGNWLLQTMDDRTQEVIDVIDWVKENHPDYSEKIGLRGASQAGWVIPKVANKDSRVAFSILAGPAINWMRQGAYDTGNQLKAQGENETTIKKAQEEFQQDGQLIQKNSTYASYKKNGGKSTMTPDRYLFVYNNLEEDITEELTHIHSPG